MLGQGVRQEVKGKVAGRKEESRRLLWVPLPMSGTPIRGKVEALRPPPESATPHPRGSWFPGPPHCSWYFYRPLSRSLVHPFHTQSFPKPPEQRSGTTFSFFTLLNHPQKVCSTVLAYLLLILSRPDQPVYLFLPSSSFCFPFFSFFAPLKSLIHNLCASEGTFSLLFIRADPRECTYQGLIPHSLSHPASQSISLFWFFLFHSVPKIRLLSIFASHSFTSSPFATHTRPSPSIQTLAPSCQQHPLSPCLDGSPENCLFSLTSMSFGKT